MGPETLPRPRATLTVGGKKVPLNRFVEAALVGVIEGFLGALKGVGGGEVVITLPAERRQRSARP
ncbi:MAG: hypothetical protein ACUVX8_03310 [Candidatus Zipacnadales bacterium]